MKNYEEIEATDKAVRAKLRKLERLNLIVAVGYMIWIPLYVIIFGAVVYNMIF